MGSTCCGVYQNNQGTDFKVIDEKTSIVAAQKNDENNDDATDDKTPPATQKKRKQCKNTQCKEDHQIHYCRVCGKQDVNHFASNCPLGTIVYHGTRKQYAQKIMEGQFQICHNGTKGNGVYFTLQRIVAQNISRHNRKNRPDVVDPVVVECLIKKDEPDVTIGPHGAWAGNLTPFMEVCVPNPKRVKSLKYYNVPIK